MKERLQKIIAASGYCSRRKAEELIAEGRVSVNGSPAFVGSSADENYDIITIDRVPLPEKGRRTYILLNKPRGYLSTLRDDRGRKTVADLTADVGERVYPVGRLDYESEGLLLMTNDGDLAHRLMHPSFELEKTYELRAKGENYEEALRILRSPLVIDGYKIKPAKVELVRFGESYALYSVTISEGRNRQIRKMCDQAGLTVLRLRRVSEGSLQLGKLPEGQWRHLERREVENLQKSLKALQAKGKNSKK